MGRPKLLLAWRGKPIIEHTIEAWQRGGADHVVVVVRANDTALAELATNLGVDVALADPPPADMKASVRWGLAFVEQRYRPSIDDVWLTAPADLPSLDPSAIQKLLAAHNRQTPAVLVASHHEQRGHPVLFPWRYASEVAHLKENEGLRQLIDGASARLIECGKGAVSADLDTPDDYARLLDSPGEP